MRFVLDIAYLLAAAAVSPMVIYRMARRGRYRIGWNQRRGKVQKRCPGKKAIWIHAVSMGEVNSTQSLVKMLGERCSDYEVVISTTTDTGYARAKALYGDEYCVFFYPLDFSAFVSRAFDNIDPAVCLLMELEVWPNFIDTAKKRNVPVVIVNGRITERSSSRYGLIKPIARSIFDKITLILAQTPQYAERFREIGVDPEKVIVTSSLKYDTAHIADKVEGADAIADKLAIAGEKIWVAGGTGTDEEKILLDVFKRLRQVQRYRDLRLIIVPRKPERFDEVAQLIESECFGCLRYSLLKDSDAKADPTDSDTVVLGDTMGDLRKFYSLAELVFTGRSLVPMGGSDMIEAAALGRCTIFGPHAFNFSQTVDALLENDGAILVNGADELLAVLQKCLTDPEYTAKTAAKGQQTIKNNQGATQKTVEQIATLLT